MAGHQRWAEMPTSRGGSGSRGDRKLLGGDAFELGNVVEVVSSHRFDDGGKGHGAALGVGDSFASVFGQGGIDQEQVPAAQDGESGESLVCVDGGIGCGPFVLVERLDDVVVFGEGLAKAEGEDGLAVGKVAKDVARAPFAGRRRSGDFGGANFLGESFEARGCGGEHGEGILIPQELRVGIQSVGGVGHVSLAFCGQYSMWS
jgi:hypothetical protein